jgi:hypothetical protein
LGANLGLYKWAEVCSSKLGSYPFFVHDAGQKARSSEQLQQFLTIPHSFLAQLAGLIDADGYIAITKTTKGYISISLRPEAPSQKISDFLVLMGRRSLQNNPTGDP